MAEASDKPADEDSSDAPERLSAAKQELLRRLRAQAGPRRLADEPIAVIGLALRLPGAPDRASLWPLLARGGDAITEVPASRWPVDTYYNPDPHRAGSVTTRWGGFLDDIDRFDPGLFAISPREAATMDPQHRLLLEQSWLALEDAGLRRDELEGSAGGVFVATYQRDYAKLATRDRYLIDAYTASGTHHSMVAGRLAYLLDLHGPALVVDTACSSSLVALHLACRSLLAGETSLALVGASNLTLEPEETIALSRFGMMAKDGRCKPFDARADGFVRGEGVVVLVLARLRDALAAGRRVRAVIVGTAVNQDGHSNGLTAPNADAQRAVITAALRDADLDPGRVGYVEAHGTGTALGDPIEMQALLATYGRPSTAAPVCAVGSIKSNLGHLEAAAGVAGFAKVVACLEHGQIPATPHFRRLNPAIDLDGSRLEIATELRELGGEAPHHAALSSFGMGGTNAHVILAQAPQTTASQPRQRSGLVLPLSAHEDAALAELIPVTREALARSEDVADYCASAARRRSHLQRRVAVGGADAAELDAALEARVGAPVSRPAPRRAVVFVCPGQGGQWLGMGRDLLAREPVFAEALTRCDEVIHKLAGWSVLASLRAPEAGALERIDRVQPLLFSLALGFAALWRDFGVQPDALIGHSMGEVAAAHLAGRLSLEDAAAVIVRRSALMRSLVGGEAGAMAAVDLPAAELAELLAARPGAPSLAAENGPRASVVAGAPAAVDALITELESREVRCRRIAVEVASHSAAVDPLEGRLREALAGLVPGPGELPLYSTLTGARLDPDTPLDADYWWRNLRERVRLWPAVQAAVADAHAIFIELGPHPVLTPALREGLDALGVRGLTLASGRRDANEQLELCTGLAALYEAGLSIDWDRVYADSPARAELPSYRFQRSVHWLPQARTRAAAGAHPFVGERLELAGAGARAGARVWTSTVSLDHAPFLRDHLVEGSCVLPGMATVDLVLSALAEGGELREELRELEFERPIVFREGEALTLQLRVEAGRFELWARAGEQGEWILRVRGRVHPLCEAPAKLELAALRARTHPAQTKQAFYEFLNATGNVWGPAFQGVAAIARGAPHQNGAEEELFVELEIPPSIAAELWRHRFHPALLDACAQALLSGAGEAIGSLVLAHVERVAIRGPAERVHASWIRVDARQRQGSRRGDVIVVDEHGAPLVEIEGLRVQYLHERQTSWFHGLSWQPAAPPVARPKPERRFALAGGPSLLRDALVEELRAPGVAHVLVDDPRASSEPATDLLHLVDLPPASDPSGHSAERELELALEACHAALQSCERASADTRLWLFTRGGAPCSTIGDPIQTAVWGLGRVMQVELGLGFAGSVDLDPAAELAELPACILAELDRDDAEPAVAYRGGKRLLARLERRPPPLARGRTSPLARLDPAASYLITGGLGGLGLRMAATLISRGARRLVLLGRSGVPPRARWRELGDSDPAHARVAALRELEALGAEVHVLSLDVADEAGLRRWHEGWVAEQRPPIRGLVHAAGIQQPRALAELDAETLRASLRAKLAGARALERVLGDQLDFTIAFSSAATLLPSPLLGAYTAANAYLEGLAIQARAAGRPMSAVAWGLLGSGGMAVQRLAEQRRLDAFEDMDPEAAFASLDPILAAELPTLAVMAIDWHAWLAAHPEAAASPYFEQLTTAGSPAAAAPGAGSSLAGMLEARGEQRRELLTAYLRQQLARVLRIPASEVEALDAHAPLTSLGIDSLMALELRNRVEAETGVAPAVVELLRGVSLTRLVEILAEQLDAHEGDDEDWEELTI
jgi:myxalamid-type polyketide synthase MxaE and MxaD